MSREHDWASGRNFCDVVDEHDAGSLERSNDGLVVHDLVIAVDGCFKDVDHPGEGLDGHFDTSAESAGFGEEDLFYHQLMLGGTSRIA